MKQIIYSGLCSLSLIMTSWVAGAQQAAPVVESAPPSAAPQRSAAELEKLAAPIALFPDPLIASMLPASVYPMEIVLAARFVADTNNLVKLDEQPWDDNVKAVARVPEAIKKMEEELAWTIDLGEAFVEQPQDLMDSIQGLRVKAQAAKTLATNPQQVVTVTNAVVERYYEQQIVYVTNTVVQIEPADPQIVYVPQYDPTVVYAPPPPTYTGPPPIVTFAAGIAVGAIIANNVDWHYGGIFVGGRGVVVIGGGHHYHPPPYGHHPPPYHRPPGNHSPPSHTRPPGYPPPATRPTTAQTTGQRWQPDPSRKTTQAGTRQQSTAKTSEARGWGSSPGTASKSVWSNATTPGNRPATGTTRPSDRPATRPTTGAAQPSTRPAARPAQKPTQRPAQRPAPSRGTSGAGVSRQPSNSGGAFGGAGNGAAARNSSNRGATSRGRSSNFGGGRGGGRR